MWNSSGQRWGYDSRVAAGTSLQQLGNVIGIDWMRTQGYTGKGVGIALIDTGVAKVPGLSGGNVVNGPDLSFESQDPATRYVDNYGHGTHLAGIIVGTTRRPASRASRPMRSSPRSRSPPATARWTSSR